MLSHPLMFKSLGAIPDDHKVTEAMDILMAGADTTASTLTAGFLHMVKNPVIKRNRSKLGGRPSRQSPSRHRLVNWRTLSIWYVVLPVFSNIASNKLPDLPFFSPDCPRERVDSPRNGCTGQTSPSLPRRFQSPSQSMARLSPQG
jgi:hypothetical protein